MHDVPNALPRQASDPGDIATGLLQALTDLGDGALVVRGGEIVHANDAALDLLPLPAAAAARVLGAGAAPSGGTLSDRLVAFVADVRAKRLSLVVEHPERGRVDLEAVVRHRLDLGQAVVLLRDVTDHRLAEAALRESEVEARKLALVASRTENAVIITDAEGRIEWVNDGFTRLTGWTTWDVIGRSPGGILQGPDSDPTVVELMRQRMRAGEGFNVELVNYAKSGTPYWVALDAQPVVDETGILRHWIAIESDVTDRRQTEAALREANDRLVRSVQELERHSGETRALSEMSEILQACRTVPEAYRVIGLWARKLFSSERGWLGILNESGNIVDVVAAWGDGGAPERVFGPDECWALRRGRPHLVDDPETGLRCQHTADRAPVASLCVPILAQGKALGVLSLRAPADGADAGHGGISPARQRLAGATVEHIALALANLKLQARLRHQSIRDPLTGLFNRRYLEETLERDLRRAERSRTPIGLIMLDVDHFKQFNDRFGHDAGDAVLREMSHCLVRNLRAGDLACRFGGEELVLVLPEADLNGTHRRAEQLRETVDRLHVVHRDVALGPVSISLGVAAYPDHGNTLDQLLRAADGALYRAKHTGRNRVEVAEPGQPAAARNEIGPVSVAESA